MDSGWSCDILEFLILLSHELGMKLVSGLDSLRNFISKDVAFL